MKSGPNPSALLALQQISELVLPQAKGSVGGVLGKGSCLVHPFMLKTFHEVQLQSCWGFIFDCNSIFIPVR